QSSMRWTPNRRERMETKRPNSRRNQCSGSSGAIMSSELRDLEDLDAREHGDLFGDLDRMRERVGLEERPAADDLLSFDVRSVRHRAASAHRRRAARLGARAWKGLLEDLLGVLGHPGLPLHVAGLHLGGRGLSLRIRGFSKEQE